MEMSGELQVSGALPQKKFQFQFYIKLIGTKSFYSRGNDKNPVSVEIQTSIIQLVLANIIELRISGHCCELIPTEK
jgi:hypothetical protein